jgi:light-regulated signal transduction histidine kinase (bacteriophytochrome)
LAWREAFAARREFRIEYRLRHRDGNWRWIYGRGIPLQTEGVFSGFIGSCVDITERIAAEQSLRAVNAELRRANTDLEQFAFAAAHDLQEPLRMVTSYTQLLRRRIEGSLDERSRQHMTFVVDAARHMSALLHDLLAYTETAQSREARSEVVSLEQVLDQALANLRGAVAESHAAIMREPLPVVAGLGSQFVQLFQNLIGNAIKYRKPGVAPEINVSVRREGNEWVFRIADNGIGIERQYQRQIFGVFKRLHGKKIPGTGIGLAICQRVVERAGGRIWVESEPGEGSAFCFTLPAAQQP